MILAPPEDDKDEGRKTVQYKYPLTEALVQPGGPPGRFAAGPRKAEASAIRLAQGSEINMKVLNRACLDLWVAEQHIWTLKVVGGLGALLQVLTSCRAFLVTARIPTKLEVTFSYLEIHGVICSKPAQMVVETEKCSISMKMASPEDVSEVLAHIGTNLRKIFPGLSPVRIMKKVFMEPSERLASLQALWDSQTVAEQGPCGGFSQMYACVCDWLGFSYREEVQWDVDTIYLTQDTRELNLQDFSHLDHRALLLGLASNHNLKGVSLDLSNCESLSLADSKLKTGVTIIINALGSNTSLTKVDISGNGMGDMGAKMLAKALQINTKL
ncbi:hypothetical protein Celaphus_00014547, partial [Cervus elaphus hippelaphus]